MSVSLPLVPAHYCFWRKKAKDFIKENQFPKSPYTKMEFRLQILLMSGCVPK